MHVVNGDMSEEMIHLKYQKSWCLLLEQHARWQRRIA